jgi:pyrroline-5-carboxylate reductase
MLVGSLQGTAELLKEGGGGFLSLIERVATKGGATEGGVRVMEQHLPEVFAAMFAAMMQRHETRKPATREQFRSEGNAV